MIRAVPRFVALFILFVSTGGAAWALDSDGDGVFDSQDNCLQVANPTQLDTDGDGFGNACDPDYDNNGAVAWSDFDILIRALGQPNPNLDLTGDGWVGVSDLNVLAKFAFGDPPGPSGLACAGTIPCACDAPALAPAEEVLSNDVELVWTAPAGSVDVERRRSGGVWTQIAHLRRGSTGFVDQTALPGGYKYRVRASCSASKPPLSWSRYSNVASIELPDECAGQPAFDPKLPVVQVGDLDKSGTYTGADVSLALESCASLGGCVLELLPVPYEDVSISISDGNPAACAPEFLSCLGQNAAFPNGLVIQGRGSRSVLRSPVWGPGYALPEPILELSNRPDIRIRLRNFVLDGRKAEQVDPTQPAVAWRHFGFSTWNAFSDHSRRNTGGCAHELTARNEFSRGISVMDTTGWVVEDNTVEDVGCYEGITECPLLTLPMKPDPVAGNGIVAGWYNDDLTVRHNEIRRVGKYAIDLKAGSDGTQGVLARAQVIDNAVTQGGSIGIFAAGLVDGLIQGNRIDSTRRPGEAIPGNFSTFGMTFQGTLDGVTVRGNQILNSAGIGINWQAVGAGNVLADNILSGSCREKNPAVGYRYPDIRVHSGAAGDLRLENDTSTGSLCAAPLGVSSGGQTDVVVHGGSYESGPAAVDPSDFEAVPVTLEAGATFDRPSGLGECVRFRTTANGQATGVVTSSVQLLGCSPPYSVDSGSDVLICSADAQACANICAGADPPEWCAY